MHDHIHTCLPGTKSILGPPVTSTATTPASWNVYLQIQLHTSYYTTPHIKFSNSIITQHHNNNNNMPKLKQPGKGLHMKFFDIWSSLPLCSEGNQKQWVTIWKNEMHFVQEESSPQYSTAFSNPLFSSRFNSSVILIEPLGPPVFVSAL